jgi:hypothetical protein
VSLYLDQCKNVGDGALPAGDEQPYGIVLLYGYLLMLNGEFIPLDLTDHLMSIIKNNLQDIVVYGKITPFNIVQFFPKYILHLQAQMNRFF